jgi:hypothetical protein
VTFSHNSLGLLEYFGNAREIGGGGRLAMDRNSKWNPSIDECGNSLILAQRWSMLVGLVHFLGGVKGEPLTNALFLLGNLCPQPRIL